ncbi:C4-dicarboxylate ABC transporter substrate-binding protein [Synergistales bacterium]|nr:C4-dicarboxylate ABC transporter substrate-binding protein [Synergistales bacterium]
MKFTARYFAALVLFVFCVIGSAGVAGAADKVNALIISHCDRETSNIHKASLAAKDFLEATGKFKVDLFSNGALSASEADALQQTADNEIQLTQAPVYVVANASGVTGFFVYDYPYFIEREEDYSKVAASDMADELAEQVRGKINVHLGRAWYNGPMTVASVNRPINEPKDLAGFKMRSTTSSITVEYLTKLGASPVPMLTSEVYTALQQGTINGTYSALHVHTDFKYDEVCKYFYKDASTTPMLIPCFSNTYYQSLTADDQKLIDEALLIFSNTAKEEAARMDAAAKQYLIDKGSAFVEPTEEHKVIMRAAGKEVRESKADMAGQKYIDWTIKILGR